MKATGKQFPVLYFVLQINSKVLPIPLRGTFREMLILLYSMILFLIFSPRMNKIKLKPLRSTFLWYC